jgi:hypothetical protein
LESKFGRRGVKNEELPDNLVWMAPQS